MTALRAISGRDAGDLATLSSKLDFDVTATLQGLRVGYFPRWMKENPATDVDRNALTAVQKLGTVSVQVRMPDWPYDSLDIILFSEGGTGNGTVDERGGFAAGAFAAR
jgi:hypothetical protein